MMRRREGSEVLATKKKGKYCMTVFLRKKFSSMKEDVSLDGIGSNISIELLINPLSGIF